jgi:hypothetical protein
MKTPYYKLFPNKKKLIECCTVRPQYGSPSASSPYIEEKSRYVRITDIDDYGNLLTEEIVSPLNFSDLFLLKENDFLIARTGNTVGKSYLHKEKNGLFSFAGYLIRFRTDESILLPDYLMAFTKTFLFEDFKRKTIKVGAQPNINAEQYSMMEIPILPINKQYNLIQQSEKYNANYKSIVSQVFISKQLKQELINKILRRIPDKYLDKLCQQVKGNNYVRVYVKYDGCQFQCSRKTIHDEYYMRHYNMKKYQFDEKRKEFFRNLPKVKTTI